MIDALKDFHLPASEKKLRGRARSGLETRIRILMAAEQLFAERSIAGVSLREIAAHARQANTSAIQYHFGDKQSLLVSLFRFRERQLDPVRAELLEIATASGRTKDLKTIFEALFLPYLTIVDEAGRHSYAGFMAEYLTHTTLATAPRIYEDEPMPAQHAIRNLLIDRLSFLPEKIIWPRVQFAAHSFASALVRWDSGAYGSGDALSFHELITDTVGQSVASLGGTYTYDTCDLFRERFPLTNNGAEIRKLPWGVA